MASFPLFYCYLYRIYTQICILLYNIIHICMKNRKKWHKTPPNENEMSIFFSFSEKWKYFADVSCSNVMKIIFSIKFPFFCFIFMNFKNICEFNLLKAIKEPNYTDRDDFLSISFLAMSRGDLYSITIQWRFYGNVIKWLWLGSSCA